MKLAISYRFRIRYLLTAPIAFVVALGLAIASESWSSGAQESDTLRASDPPANAIWVDGLDLSKMSQGRPPARAGKSVRNTPLQLNGVVYPHGIGAGSNSELLIDLKGEARSEERRVGKEVRTWMSG